MGETLKQIEVGNKVVALRQTHFGKSVVFLDTETDEQIVMASTSAGCQALSEAFAEIAKELRNLNKK